MKKLICIMFILTLMSPLFAEEFTLKKASKNETIFNLLQFSGYFLINTDIVFTYNSIWNYGGKIRETNPFWRMILDRPPLVFTTVCLINIGIIIGSSWLYKKNKFLAYVFVALVNIIEIYCIGTHVKLWKKLA